MLNISNTPVSADMPVAEAGRHLMAGQLAIVQDHMPYLRRAAAPGSVHDARKAIRRTFTLIKLFRPYFAANELEPYRKGLRRLMRRLAPCRDIAVFREKLTAFSKLEGQSLPHLIAYWDKEQANLDNELRGYLKKPGVVKFLRHYEHFTQSANSDQTNSGKANAPLLIRHVLPGLIYQRLGTLRAFGDILPTATPAQFHQLRIQFKELRYTLTFFEELLGPKITPVIDITRQVQDHLGHLNDTDVAISMLAAADCCPEEAAVYHKYQHHESERLMLEFPALYAQFDRPKIRRRLACVLSNL